MVAKACPPVGEKGFGAGMLLLERLLEGLDVEVAPFAVCEVREGAAFVLEGGTNASLHYILSGAGVARPQAGPAFALSPHTVLVAPPGYDITVACGAGDAARFPQPACEPLPGGWERLRVGAGGHAMIMACGAVRATHREVNGLFDYLREPLVESVGDEAAFRDAFRLLLAELAHPSPGTAELARTLMKQCLIVLLRRHCERGECRVPWLAALEHREFGRVVSAMLDRPEARHSLQSLADLAGMSRAAFAARFRQAFGRPPMQFLKEVRLRRAARLLATTDLPVKAVAARVGFASRSYFSRAFKAFADADPVRFRASASIERRAPADR